MNSSSGQNQYFEDDGFLNLDHNMGGNYMDGREPRITGTPAHLVPRRNRYLASSGFQTLDRAYDVPPAVSSLWRESPRSDFQFAKLPDHGSHGGRGVEKRLPKTGKGKACLAIDLEKNC